MPTIPARIFWPGFIFTLLGIAISASFAILYFAQSDGGPQVIPDYYERSINFDELYQARQHSLELGWSVDVELAGTHGILTIADSDGAPVNNAQGTLRYFRPSLATPVASVELREDPDQPGVYHFDDHADLPGVWDLDIAVHRNDDAFTTRLRQTVPTS